MKQSFYNYEIQVNGKKYVYNTLGSALAELEEEYIDVLWGKNTDEQKTSELAEQGFLVSDDVDELGILKNRFFSAKYSESVLALTILPSLGCNFSCTYCYQSENHTVMDEKTCDAIVDFVKKKTYGLKKLLICWFGGEPLLHVDIIEYISEKLIKICDEYDIEYVASMVSNGFLFSEKNIEKLKACKLRDVQITIDGPAEIHNQRRPHKNKNIDTFSKCFSAIELLQKFDIDVDIRINVDKTNKEYVPALTAFIQEKNFTNITIDFAKVTEYTEASHDVHGVYYNGAEFEIVNLELLKNAVNCGAIGAEFLIPEQKCTYCGAEKYHDYCIGPSGEFYKCWCDIGDKTKTIGNVFEFERDCMLRNESLYMDFNPFEYEKCRNCKLLPVCMGGCPKEKIFEKDALCEEKEKALIKKIIHYVS